MTPPLLKWGIRVFAAFMVLAALIVTAAALIMNTQAGTRWGISRLDTVLEGELDTGEFEGTLLRGMIFPRLSYRDTVREVEATNLVLAINWSTLLARRLTLGSFRADTLHYRSLVDAEPVPFEIAFQPLPVDVSVSIGSIDQLTVVGNGDARKVSAFVFQDARLDAEKLRVAAASASTSGIEVGVSRVSVELRENVPIAAKVHFKLANGEWSGQGKVGGTLAELSFDLAVAGPYPGMATGAVKLLHRIEPDVDVTINWENWSFGDYELIDGEVRLRGLPARFSTTYDATASRLDDFQVSVRGTGTGDTKGLDTFDASFQGEAGRGRLAGSLSWSDGTLHCADCVVQVGENHLAVRGGLTAGDLDVSLSGDAPRLDDLWPGLSGAASVRGTLSGPLKSPVFRGLLRMTNPGFGDWSATGIDIDSAAAGFDEIDFTARVEGLHKAGVNYGTFFAVARGELSALKMRADWNRGDHDGYLTGTIRQQETGIAGTVKTARINEANTGQWNLVEPFAFRFAAGNLEVDGHGWSNQGSELRVSTFVVTDGNSRVVADLSSLPLALANPWLPPNMKLLGSADAAVDLEQRAGRWSGSIDWRQTGTVLRVAEINDQVTDVIIPRVEIDAALQDDAIEAKALVSIEPEVSGELDLRLETLRPDAMLRAVLRVEGKDWDWVSAVIPQVDKIEGSIDALVRAQGPLTAPEFLGDVSWRNGKLRIPALNVPLDDIDVVVSGASAGTATLFGTAKAGDGTLSITGQFNNLMQQERSVRLRLTGKSAELIGWPEYRLWATPDLTVVGNQGGWRFDGSVEVPRANVEVRDLPVEAVPVSADVVVLGAEEPVRPSSRVSGEARLIIGDRVRVKALGLESGLSGTLSIRVVEDAAVSAEGAVSLVGGVFTGYGQKLTIREGTLTFTGPLDNPIVDVTAVRVIETLDGQVTAGIRLRGRALNLISTVFAEPAMSEADALSYLVIGRPLNQATAAEGGDLTGAALALGIKQAARLTEQIAQTLGLDQLSLTGDGGETTALVAGKQVNSRLYARYAYGVFSRLGVLFLRYRLSEKLSLEASTGENQSIDVIYSVEKD